MQVRDEQAAISTSCTEDKLSERLADPRGKTHRGFNYRHCCRWQINVYSDGVDCSSPDVPKPVNQVVTGSRRAGSGLPAPPGP